MLMDTNEGWVNCATEQGHFDPLIPECQTTLDLGFFFSEDVNLHTKYFYMQMFLY